jgi:quercetin dioxygenase-like cupin family protein
MTTASNKNTSVLLDRITLAPGATHTLKIAAGNLAWFQVLDGAATLTHAGGTLALTEAHVAFVPPSFSGTLTSTAGAALLFAEVPDAARFDAQMTNNPPQMRIVDWTQEPVLDSEHDARKRIYMVTPKLFGTKAIKGEMIIYPPGTQAANHHHEGAEHFMYVLTGSGTAWANEQPFNVRKGDLIWYADRERHLLKSDDAAEMRFVEFFVPGVFKTTWAPGASVCTWTPTGRNIQGGAAAREIAHHRADMGTPQDV